MDLARQALREYDEAMIRGEEPAYPVWAEQALKGESEVSKQDEMTDKEARELLAKYDLDPKEMINNWLKSEQEERGLPERATTGFSRAEWHDKAWALFHAKTFEDTHLAKVNMHTIRAVFDATYDALEAAALSRPSAIRAAAIEEARLDGETIARMMHGPLLTDIGYRALLNGDTAEVNLDFFVRLAELLATTRSLSSQADGWVSVSDRLPESGKTVLAYYINRAGKGRRVRAQWISAKTVESNSDSEIGVYDEETDTFYDPEGWYEQIDNWGDYTSVAVVEGEITHWHNLPAAPSAAHKGEWK